MNSPVICLSCEKEFNKRLSQIKRSPNHFCSKSCSVSHWNKISPKRKKILHKCNCGKNISEYKKVCRQCEKVLSQKRCCDCNLTCKGLRCKSCYTKTIPLKSEYFCSDCNKKCHSKRCKDCHGKHRMNKNLTLKRVIYRNHHKSSAFALVRTRARTIAKKLGWESCKKCGYNKHIEIAHVKPINSFPEDSLVSEINNPKNLLPLCPNCHWEFDNKLWDTSSL